MALVCTIFQAGLRGLRVTLKPGGEVLEVTQIGDVTEIRMGRSLDGQTALYWVAAYVVGGILIDTGCDYTKNELIEFLIDKRVSKIINTHYHEDHIGANALLSERFGLRAFAHPETVRLMAEKHDLYPFEIEVWGRPAPCAAVPIPTILEDSAVRLRVIETSGHCRGHISLFEETRGILFSGDTWVGERPKTARSEEDLPRIIVDLGKFEKLRPKIMFASLGKVVSDPSSVIERTRTYLEETRGKILQLHRQGRSSEQIRDELFGRESVLAEFTQYELSTKIFVESFLRKT